MKEHFEIMKIPNYMIPYMILIIIALLICLLLGGCFQENENTIKSDPKIEQTIRDTSVKPAEHIFECLTSEDAKACIYIMLRSHGYPVDFDSIDITVADANSLAFGLNCYFEENGCLHSAYYSSNEDIYFPTVLYQLQEGTPSMVYLKDHWAVAYAASDTMIQISDPWKGMYDIEVSKFNDIWTQSGKQIVTIN